MKDSHLSFLLNTPAAGKFDQVNTARLLILYIAFSNLIRIVSESNNPNNYYRKPRLSIDKLQEVVKGKNLISFCGHMGSYIPDLIANNPDNYQKLCLNFVDQMKDIFGKENFFLETHWHRNQE